MVAKFCETNFESDFESYVWQLPSQEKYDAGIKISSKIMIKEIAKVALDFYNLALRVMDPDVKNHMPKDAGLVLARALIHGKFFIIKGDEKSWKYFLSYCFNLMKAFDEYNGYYDTKH